MKLAVVAANGRVAQKVIKEALDRGFEVKAFGRDAENKTAATDYVQKDIMDLTKEDLADFDAVVDGFGAWKDEEQPMHVTTSQHLCDVLSGTNTRLLIVGGAGSLYVNSEHTVQVKDGADFPAIFLPLANAQGQELEELRKRKSMTQSQLGSYLDVDNTTISMYEAGQRQLTPSTIRQLCDLFECSADYLLGFSDYSEHIVSDRDAAILSAYHAASEKERSIIDTMLAEYMPHE